MKRILSLITLLSVVNADLSGDVDTVEFPHKKGSVYIAPKDIERGCARFYISDPIKNPDGTKYWQVCTPPQRDKSYKVAVGEGVFTKVKDKYGAESVNSISYISTGPDCWVNIYTQPKFQGKGYEITPLRDVDLSLLNNHENLDQLSFNDNILSGYLRSTDGDGENPDSQLVEPGIIPIAVWYKFYGAPRQNTDNGCAYFYDSDPNEGDVNGVILCVSNDQHLAHVSVSDLKKRGLLLKKDKAELKLISQNKKWSGDKEPAFNAKHLHLRRLSSKYSADFFSDIASVFESIVQDVEYAFESIVEVFVGPPPSNTTQIANITLPPPPPPPPAPPAPLAPPAEEAPLAPPAEEAPLVSAKPAAPILKFEKDLTGIRYVEAGPDVDIAIFDRDEFKGKQKLVKHGHVLAIDPEEPVNSFYIISQHYKKTVAPPREN